MNFYCIPYFKDLVFYKKDILSYIKSQKKYSPLLKIKTNHEMDNYTILEGKIKKVFNYDEYYKIYIKNTKIYINEYNVIVCFKEEKTIEDLFNFLKKIEDNNHIILFL